MIANHLLTHDIDDVRKWGISIEAL